MQRYVKNANRISCMTNVVTRLGNAACHFLSTPLNIKLIDSAQENFTVLVPRCSVLIRHLLKKKATL